MLDRFHSADSLDAARITLVGTEAQHLARVLRKEPGEQVTLFDGKGNEVRAQIDAIQRGSVTLSVCGTPLSRPTTGRRVVLACAVPKGDRARWLVEKATELGASAWVPLLTERSVVHPGDVKLEKLRQTVITACKQCGRNDLMPIQQPQNWCSFLATPRGDASLLVAHPTGSPPGEWLHSMSLEEQVPMTVAIGPEGGFTDEELESSRACGARLIGLGESVLRIETAAIAALSAIRMHCRD